MPLNNPAAGLELKTATYTGDNSVNRAIPHGLTKTPVALLGVSSQGSHFVLWSTQAVIYAQYGTGEQVLAVTAMDSTYFYVGNAFNYFHSANANTIVYYWVAIA